MPGRDWSNYDTAQAKNLAYLYEALGLSRLDQVCERLGIQDVPKDYAVDSTSYQSENRSVPLVQDQDTNVSNDQNPDTDPETKDEEKSDDSLLSDLK